MTNGHRNLVSREYLEAFINNQLDGDRDFFLDLVQKLKNQLDDFAKIKELAKARLLAHKLRSSFQAFGCVSADQLLYSLESAQPMVSEAEWRKIYEECVAVTQSAMSEIEQLSETIFAQRIRKAG